MNNHPLTLMNLPIAEHSTMLALLSVEKRMDRIWFRIRIEPSSDVSPLLLGVGQEEYVRFALIGLSRPEIIVAPFETSHSLEKAIFTQDRKEVAAIITNEIVKRLGLRVPSWQMCLADQCAMAATWEGLLDACIIDNADKAVEYRSAELESKRRAGYNR